MPKRMTAKATQDLLGSDDARQHYQSLPRRQQLLITAALKDALPVLEKEPAQLASQLWGRLSDQEDPALQGFLSQLIKETPALLLPKSRCLPSPTSPLLRTFAGHKNFVGALRLLPDGRLLSTSEDSSMRLWNLSRDKSTQLSGHFGPINCVALSRDGASLATASDDHNIGLWNTEGPKLIRTLRGHSNHVRDVAFTPDDSQLVSCSSDGSLRVWDLKTGDSRVITKKASLIVAMAVSSVEPLAAIATMDNSLILVDLLSGEERILYDCSKNFRGMVMGMSLAAANQSEIGHRNFAKELLFSHDGKTLYSAEESLLSWDVTSGQQLERRRGNAWPITGLALSSDGSRIATAAESVLLWDLSSKDEPIKVGGHSDKAHTVLFGPEDQTLFIGYHDGPIKHWDLSRPSSFANKPGHQGGTVVSLAISSDESLVASGGSDKNVIIWELSSGRQQELLGGFTALFVYALSWTKDGRLYASSGKDLIEWDTTSRGERSWPGNPYFDARYLAPLADGEILSAGFGKGLLRWPNKGDATFLAGHQKDWNTTDFFLSNDGETAFQTAYRDKGVSGAVWVWDLLRNELIQTLDTPGEYITALRQVGRYLIGGGSTGGLYLWDIHSRELLRKIDASKSYISQLIPMPQERLLIGGYKEQHTTEWDLASGSMLKELIFLDGCGGLCASQDGARIAGYREKTVFLYDTQSQALLASFTCDNPVYQLKMSKDGETIIAGSGGGDVTILKFVQNL